MEELIATYGDAVRAAPARRGFGLVAWIAPALGLLAAFAWLTRRLWRATRSAAERRTQPVVAVEPTADATAPERAALAALLRQG